MSRISATSQHSPHPFSLSYKTHSSSRQKLADRLSVDPNSTPHTLTIPPVPPMPAHAFVPCEKGRSSGRRISTPSPLPAVRRIASSPIASPPPPFAAPVFESQPPLPRRTPARSNAGARSKARKQNHHSPSDLKHIRAQAPERKGLYTLAEVDEDWEMLKEQIREKQLRKEHRNLSSPSPLRFRSPSPIYSLSSARASSNALAPSPEPSCAVFEDGLEEVLTDSDSSHHQVVTPQLEAEDPFALKGAWDDNSDTRFTQTFLDLSPSRPPKGRRPPPLDLALSIRKHSASLPLISQSPPSSMLGQEDTELATGLLSPLPISSPGVANTRRRATSGPPRSPPKSKRRSKEYDWQVRDLQPAEPVDLESALNDFLTCCGERPSRTDRSSPYSTFSSDTDNDGLFHLRSESFAESSDDEHRGTIASAFPLPPSRQRVPFRPSREDDMGLGPLSALSDLALGFGLDSPAQFSSDLTTPRTPPSLGSAFVLSLPPPPPSQAVRMTREKTWAPALQGDHSFLRSMSAGEDVSMAQDQIRRSGSSMSYNSFDSSSSGGTTDSSGRSGSRGSSSSGSSASSRRSLPRRAPLPDSWKVYGMGRI